MNPQQLVAILGGHSLGRATMTNTGFDGGWTRWQSTFSNQYYIGLIGPKGGNPSGNNGDTNGGLPWDLINDGVSPAPFWANHVPTPQPPKDIIMLPIDIETVYTPSTGCPHFFLGSGAHPQGCTLNTDTIKIVNDFATNMNYFYGNFTDAWVLSTEYEYLNLLMVTPF